MKVDDDLLEMMDTIFAFGTMIKEALLLTHPSRWTQILFSGDCSLMFDENFKYLINPKLCEECHKKNSYVATGDSIFLKSNST